MVQGGASGQREGDRMGVVPSLPTLLHMVSPHPDFPGCDEGMLSSWGGAEHVLCNSLSAYNI